MYLLYPASSVKVEYWKFVSLCSYQKAATFKPYIMVLVKICYICLNEAVSSSVQLSKTQPHRYPRKDLQTLLKNKACAFYVRRKTWTTTKTLTKQNIVSSEGFDLCLIKQNLCTQIKMLNCFPLSRKNGNYTLQAESAILLIWTRAQLWYLSPLTIPGPINPVRFLTCTYHQRYEALSKSQFSKPIETVARWNRFIHRSNENKFLYWGSEIYSSFALK